ncbi:chemotaxis protein CheA [Pseudaquabacterium pictum]|uniref:Chemotaxis protein CheA n=1 Tax=Pseudaquabacterium pictum TaxID=2315236 RepID=A0A480ASZ2_9BURK|nr:chemotaxis protein CheA [Rubrivivax pictus]GCL62855.1 chemotaxis protein CheA [Rubrivivax pictus]
MKPMDMDLQFVAEALPAFLSEAREQITAIEQLLLQLEDAPEDRELLDALFRCAHTVKGSAGIFGLDAVVDFTHHVESLLDRLRDGQLLLTPVLSTLLLRCNDQIRALVDAATQADGGNDPDGEAARQALVQQLQAAGAGPAAAPAPAPVAAAPAAPSGGCWQIGASFGAETFRNGMDPLTILRYVAGLGAVSQVQCDTAAVPTLEALDPECCHLDLRFALDTPAPASDIEAAFSFVRDDCQLQLQPPAPAPTPVHDSAPPEAAAVDIAPLASRLGELLVQDGAATADAVQAALQKQARQRGAGTPAPADDNRFIRVQADRLDAVINLLGELVIAGAGAQLLARQTKQRNLIEANTQIGRLIEEIRNGTLKLRMVPIGETFSRFRRVVRDTAAELGKDVALEIVGGDTELDKSVVERIADPLMHLVRNGLDHGLEPPAERTAAGKPAQGRLVLSACHEAGGILIRIQDDGRGIHRERVLARAWDRGIVERGVTPPDDAILQLIFEPGFSTAEKVTNLSGRGVGMDVVRRNIEALRGTVTVRSTEGAGSTIDIRLPLTLAIIDGFLIGVGSTKFIFPLDAVVEVIEQRSAALQPDSRGRACVELRGRVLPVVDLRSLYQLDGTPPPRVSVVVIQSQGRAFGVVVDALLGQHQTVIKPLSPMFRSLRGISGSSILGSGEVALIFDAASLSQLAAQPALT